jgi:hypothetical protein
MKFNNIFVVFVLSMAFCFSSSLTAQTGGRKKEHRNQRGGGSLFHRKKSSGHADAFAKGGSKKGLFARIFKGKKSNGPWVYKKTNPGIKQRKEQARLFSRNRTNSKRFRDGVLANQNKKRSSTRIRGNSSFGKKKH